MMLVMGGHNQSHTVDMKAAMLGRVRNMSGGSTGSMESDLSRSWGSTASSFDLMKAGSAISQLNNSSTAATTCIQPRSISESSDGSSTQSQQNGKQVLNPGRYKTEMCRPFGETGHCKYGEKCQFAHGPQEMRGLPRHPKYKTELCRTFHTVGFCPYGPRCHFIHSEDGHKLVEISHMKHQQAAQQAAKEMAQQAAQIQAQHQALQAQLSALVTQVNHQFSVTSPPTVYPVGPSVALPPSPFLLGSTADSPPESPVGSLNDEVFQQQQSPLIQPNQMEFFPGNVATAAIQIPSKPSATTTTPGMDGLTSVMGSLYLDNCKSMESAAITSHHHHPQVLQQDPSPPSSPDSLCSSLDSSRGSRLPVFSKLASE